VRTIQKSCGLLTDAINLSQRGLQRARKEIDDKFDHVRQAIHKKTAPKAPGGPASAAAAPEAPAAEPPPATSSAAPKSAPKARAKRTSKKAGTLKKAKSKNA
jgi:hypothetical protein